MRHAGEAGAGASRSVEEFSTALIEWYDRAARDLPWRRPDAGAWAVLLSEIMLQQTPVARVLPVYEAWLRRWPTPAALAAEPAGEAVRAWGRLGYPRRALRLHECAGVIAERHGGVVPASVEELLALPGIGAYTARAVAAFAYQQRTAVIDTNVRRVLARAMSGLGDAGPASTRRDLALMEPLLPVEPARAARFSVAAMELGALVCTARGPRCTACPLVGCCAWRRAGCPPYEGPTRRPQAFAGTNRQVRGALLAVLRDADGPVSIDALTAAWAEDGPRERALGELVADGLVQPLPDGRYALPG